MISFFDMITSKHVRGKFSTTEEIINVAMQHLVRKNNEVSRLNWHNANTVENEKRRYLILTIWKQPVNGIVYDCRKSFPRTEAPWDSYKQTYYFHVNKKQLNWSPQGGLFLSIDKRPIYQYN